jgi:hypothetical protein
MGRKIQKKIWGVASNLTSRLALVPDTRVAMQEDQANQGILLDGA